MKNLKKCNCTCRFTEQIKDNSAAIWLFAICGFLLGIIVGFTFSPIKKGVNIGSGNNSHENENCKLYYTKDGDDEDYDDDAIKF